MLRGKVTNVTSAGVFVQTADFGTVGPCQAVNAPYTAGDMVLCVNVGDDTSPDLVVIGTVSATGSASLAVSAPAGADAGLQFRTGLLRRWNVNRAWDAESGSNAGSTFNINRYNDAGGWLSTSVSIDRATGRVTFGDVTTSSGIELGSGGPRITIGTGAPSHSAPNGSVYLRTDGTATTTLYVRAGGAWSALS